MKFIKATKEHSFGKIALAGWAGSGKTYTALTLAQSLSKKRVALIETEPGAASKYADLFDFDVCELALDENGLDVVKPFSPERFIETISVAASSGLYDVLIIDSLSSEWDDDGGVLAWVDELTLASRNNDSRAAWKKVTPVHRKFINYLLRVQMHVICTLKVKKAMALTTTVQGRTVGKKVPLEPIQREDVPYAFDIFGTLDENVLLIEKTRCSALNHKVIERPGADLAATILSWLDGAEPQARRVYDPTVQPGKTETVHDLLGRAKVLALECGLIEGQTSEQKKQSWQLLVASTFGEFVPEATLLKDRARVQTLYDVISNSATGADVQMEGTPSGEAA